MHGATGLRRSGRLKSGKKGTNGRLRSGKNGTKTGKTSPTKTSWMMSAISCAGGVMSLQVRLRTRIPDARKHSHKSACNILDTSVHELTQVHELA